MNTAAAVNPDNARALVRAADPVIGLLFRLTYPDGRSEQVVVDAERALLGSAAHCEVRLPAEVSPREHIEVFATDSQVHLAVRPLATPPVLDGAPCSQGVWRAGAVLAIGAIRVTVEAIDLTTKQKGRSPFLLFLPVAITILLGVLLYPKLRPTPEPPIPPAPALFDAPVAACTQAPSPDRLPGYAQEKLRLALAKRERGPFSPADAVDAVALFEGAAACFESAGQPDEAREASAAATVLRQKLEAEYHLRRVRLEHAFRVGDPFATKRELEVLRPMTSRRTGTYVEWLAAVDRQATIECDARRTGRLY